MESWNRISGIRSTGEIYPAVFRWIESNDSGSRYWHAEWRTISIGIIEKTESDRISVRRPFEFDTSVARRILVVSLYRDVLDIFGFTSKRVASDENEIYLNPSDLVRSFVSKKIRRSVARRSRSCDLSPVAETLVRLCSACAEREEGTSEKGRGFAGFPRSTLEPEPSLSEETFRSLVANVIASPRFYGSARVAVSLVSDAAAELNNLSDGRSVLSTKLSDLGTVTQVYFRAKTNDPTDFSVHRFSDGSTVQRGSEEDLAVRFTRDHSAHRNGTPPGDLVFAIAPASVAFVRASAGCAYCHGSDCQSLRPLVSGDGSAYLTGSDIRVAMPIGAGLRFASSVAVATTSVTACIECTCGYLEGDPETCERCTEGESDDGTRDKFRESFGAAADLAMGRSGHVVRRIISRCAAALEYTLMPGSSSARTSAYSTAAARDEAGARFSVAEPRSPLSSFLCAASAAHPTKRAKRLFLVPGYRELSDSGWDVHAIAMYAPPCIANIIEECAKRHPKYSERVRMLSFLCSIDGVLEDERGLRIAWKRMFEHHEDIAARNRLSDDDNFMRSKYGKVTLDDAVRCAKRGFRWGCQSAISEGTCPYSGLESNSAEEIISRVSDIEDACGRSSGSVGSEIRGALGRECSCRRACSARASSISGKGTIVKSPVGFYSVIYEATKKT